MSLSSLTPAGLKRDARVYMGAKLGIRLLGARGDLSVWTRAEYTDPRARLAELASELGRSSAELAKLPQEIIHVRRPVSAAEHAALPEWFSEAEPIDEAGDGVPIPLP